MCGDMAAKKSACHRLGWEEGVWEKESGNLGLEEDVGNGGGWEMSRLGDEVVATDLVSPPIGEGGVSLGFAIAEYSLLAFLELWPTASCGFGGSFVTVTAHGASGLCSYFACFAYSTYW